MTGIILAGGKSRRIGEDKAFLEIDNKPLIELVVERLKAVFNKIIIVTNDPVKFQFLGIKVVKDVVFNKGPLGGIYTGLLISETKYNFICACDMPFLSSHLLKFMSSEVEGNDVVVPIVGNFAEPLHSIYSKNCLMPIKRHLENGELRVRDFFPEVKCKYIPENLIRKYDPHLQSFFNLNTPKMLESVKKEEKINEK